MTKSDVQTSLRLSEELRDRLAQAAAENEHGIGEEMRRRLEASFKSEPVGDPATSKLAEAIRLVARCIRGVYPPWHDDLFAFLAFKTAVDTLLEHFEPEGEENLRPNMPQDPKATGLLLAGMALGALDLPLRKKDRQDA